MEGALAVRQLTCDRGVIMTNEGKIIAFPTLTEFNRIIADDAIDIISPFYSRWALERLTPSRHFRVRFITRLPITFSTPPPFLDNDPQPLKEAMTRMGSAFRVFALPRVHAKLYLTATAGWLGSANFTHSGFSGIGELILRFTPPSADLRRTFTTFRSKATPVTEKNIQFLVDNVRSGLTKLRPDLDIGKGSADASIEDAVSYGDFEKWLERQIASENATYISQRMHNKNRMSGHSYSGFHGTFSFLRKNQAIGRQLLELHGLPVSDTVLSELANFVRDYGDRFGGPRGGTWRSKLSVRLGGVHSGGGAGDALVKRLLIEVPRYMSHKGLL